MGLRLTLDWGSAISPNLGLNLPQQIFCKIERKVKVQNYTNYEDECQHTANERRLTVQPIGITPKTWGDISDEENDDDYLEVQVNSPNKAHLPALQWSFSPARGQDEHPHDTKSCYDSIPQLRGL